MKILKLEIENIASIKNKTVIDFTHGPLSTEPIFLITGQTGTGKTTILNSICVALYNAVPSLTAQGDKASSDINSIRITSTEQLVRRDAKAAHIQLIFEANDKRYEAKWEKIRVKKRNGALEYKGDHTLNGIGFDYFKKNKEVANAVAEITGFTFDQFCRTSMLAQGQFLKFLSSTIKEKGEILEKLTGTDIYSKIGKSIYDIYTKTENRRRELQAKVDGANLLSDNQISNLKDGIGVAEEDLKKAKANAEAYTSQKKWLEDDQKARKQLADAQAKLNIHNSEENQRKMDQEAQAINDWNDTEEIRKILTGRSDAQNKYNQAQEKISKNHEDYIKCCQGLASVSQAIEKTQSKLQAKEARFQEMAPMEEMIQRAGELTACITDIESAIKKTNAEKKKAESNKAALEQSLLSIKTQEETVEKAKLEAEQKSNSAKAAQAETDKHDLKQISEKIQAADKRKTAIDNASALLNEAQSLKDQLLEANTAKNNATESIAKAETLLTESQTAEKQLLEARDAAKNRLDGKTDLESKLTLLTQVFAEEKKCPLCGSEVSGLLARDVINEDIKAAKQEYDTALAAFTAQQKESANINSQINLWKKQKTELDRKSASIDKSLKEKEARIKTALSQLGIAEGADPKISLEAEKNLLAELRKALTMQLTDAQNARNALNAALQTQKAAEKAYDAAKQKLADLEKERQSIENEINSSNLLIAEYEKSASDKQKVLSEGLVFAFDPANLAAAKGKLLEIKNEYTVLCKEIETLTKEKERLAATQSAVSEMLCQLKKQFGDAPSNLSAIPVNNLEEKTRQLSSGVTQLLGVAHAYKQAEKEWAEQENAYFETNDRDTAKEKISRLGALTLNDIEQKRKALNEFKLQGASIEGEVEVARKLLNEIASSKPEGIPEENALDIITLLLTTAIAAQEEALKRKTEAETRLKNNEDNIKAQEETIGQLTKAQKEAEKWSCLNDLFGGADGAKFRKKAQSFLFAYLLDRANFYLTQLTRRYSLEADIRDENLLIYVIDKWDNDAKRIANSLSGGEGFIASLALALGLSSVSTDKDQFDMLFIDEGFGTLDTKLLNEVINMLETLQKGAGRKVGIISHMTSLAERIPTQIKVERTADESFSTIILPK